ncbi:MAG: methyltransferase domain-containing protein [Parazoarcus communis]
MAWDPDRYLAFGDLRSRPALDLLARIPLSAPSRIVDLGCGPGTVTTLLRQRWPEARLTGVDRSAEMLARAAALDGGVEWVEADLSSWQGEPSFDLIFSNAALHWLDGHAELFPRLQSMLAPGGVLAVQMPANFDADSHRLIRELAASSRWRDRVANARMGSVLTVEAYHDLLAGGFQSVEIWETRYLQVLRGEDAVLQWLSGTTLLPYLDCLSDDERDVFIGQLRPLLRQAYPMRGDGRVLFPFKRVFMVAVGAHAHVSRETR